MACHVLGHPKPCNASFCERIEREHNAIRAEERAKIVAWLRDYPEDLSHVADRIESGAHETNA